MSVVLLPASSPPVHPSFTLSPCTTYACACVHLLAARLLQQRFVWCQCLPPRSSSIHSQRCGKAYFESLEVRSYLRRYAKRVALAPYCATYQLQDLPSRAQLSGGYWSIVPIRILQPGELRGRKTSSSFCCRSDLVKPRYRLERYGRRGFSIAGPHLWNLLPPDVRNYETGLDTFKKRLKTFLMQR